MTVEESMSGEVDRFPIGVLAVDDDPTCLMLLENLLRKCQYHQGICRKNELVKAGHRSTEKLTSRKVVEIDTSTDIGAAAEETLIR